jgi:hypothetical protein
MIVAFAVVLIGGVAMAAVGVFGGAGDEEPAPVVAEQPDESKEAPATEDTKPTEPPADEPKSEPPATEPPAEEPKPEPPAEEPEEEEEPEPEKDTTPPALVITSPEDGAHVDDEVVTFRGEVEQGATVSWSKYEAKVTDGGAWSIALKLAAGKNVMVFVATDAAGNATEKSVTVHYEAPEPKHAFTANQKWEIVDGDPAVNKYWGTAEPGAKVWIGSDYGSKAVTTGPEGGWEMQIAFEAPCNTWFGVVVESGAHRKVFEMKRACAEEHLFTAKQQYGECSEATPFDVFHGTAAPGATIWVESKYGSGTTTANAEGAWELQVDFPEAPRGKTFEVVVESSDGGRKVFTFVATEPPA